MSNRLFHRDHRTPTLDLNFLAMSEQTFDRRITFSRPSHAMMFDATGRLTFAQNNLVFWSGQFNNASWNVLADATLTAGQTSYNGSLTAFNGVPTVANAYHFVRTTTGMVAITGRQVFSVYAKANGYNFLNLQIAGDISYTQYVEGHYNLSSGTVEGTSRSAVWTASRSIQSIGNGWYRCVLVVETATAVSGVLTIGFASTSDPATTFSGNGTSGVLIADAQFERVTYETAPRPYIATGAAAYYGPRLDYDPVTRAARGLLVEEARTNLALHSQTISNNEWTVENATKAQNATGPDGVSNSAGTLTATATNTFHQVYMSTQYLLTAARTFSVFVKQGTSRYCTVAVSPGSGNYVSVTADLLNGTITQSTSAGSTAFVSSSIAQCADGWYRITVNSVTGASTAFLIISIANAATFTPDAFGRPVFSAVGTETILIYGAQVEAGAFATSYIPTTTASVARSADLVGITVSGLFSQWYNRTRGSFVVSHRTHGGEGVRILGRSGANDPRLFINAGSRDISYRAEESGDLASLSRAYTLNVPHKIATSYVLGGTQRFALDTFMSDIRNTGIGPAFQEVTFHAFNAPASGHYARVRYFPFNLSESELKALTI